MSDAFAKFHKMWLDRDFLMDSPPGSEDVRHTANGHAGQNGAIGTPGDSDTAPGAGEDGGDGKNSNAIVNTGSALVFHKANPIGQWLLDAQSGNGGLAGKGGDAGTFDPSADTGPWPSGGDGGDGGNSGGATAQLHGHTIWGHRGPDSGDGLSLNIYARTGVGGNGGRGGQGDGEGGPVIEHGGDGGDGGKGGGGGDALVQVTNNAFKSTGTGGDFRASIFVVALGGNGGDAGPGGHGGIGLSLGDGANGAGAAGGYGGDGTIVMDNDTFTLSGAAGTDSTLFIDMIAYGGNGGNASGYVLGQPAPGGVAGDCSIIFRNIDIVGGAENDAIGLDLKCLTGSDGDAGDLTSNFHVGTATYLLRNITIEGGGGNNTFGFAVGVNQSDFAVSVDIAKGTFNVNGVRAGKMAHIQNVVGAAGEDVLKGDTRDNVLTGGGGDDRMTGGLGADTFFYNTHYESWAYGWDTLTDINFHDDKISLPFEVKHIEAPVTGATLHSNTFIPDMTSALNGHLKVGHALLIDAQYVDGAVTTERTFLVIDADGIAGYSYEDMVIDVTGYQGNLQTDTFIERMA